MFVTLQAYLIDGDAESRPGYSSKTSDLLLVFVGVGEFTATPQPHSDEKKGIAPGYPRDFRCQLQFGAGDPVLLPGPGVLHANGTAYEGSKGTRGTVHYFGERAVWVSCPVPRAVVPEWDLRHGQPAEFVARFFSREFAFDSTFMRPQWLLSAAFARAPAARFTLCTSALWNLSGAKWLIEWVEYHRLLGFDSFDVYVDEVGELTHRVIRHYQQEGLARVRDWTTINENHKRKTPGFHSDGAGNGVTSWNWEHAQRLARTDCFFRNRGRSEWVAFIDVDEVFAVQPQQPQPGPDQPPSLWRDVILPRCEGAHAGDPLRIACSFASVTVPPNVDPSMPEKALLLQKIHVSERHCQSPYNCGEFHNGRQKYALRTRAGSLNPMGPLFYHAVSQNYQVSRRLHVQIPETVAVSGTTPATLRTRVAAGCPRPWHGECAAGRRHGPRGAGHCGQPRPASLVRRKAD